MGWFNHQNQVLLGYPETSHVTTTHPTAEALSDPGIMPRQKDFTEHYDERSKVKIFSGEPKNKAPEWEKYFHNMGRCRATFWRC